MTTVAKSKTKQRRAGADEPPRIFHIYNRNTPQTALCGDVFKNGKYRLGDSKTYLPRSGYEFCPLCVLEMQLSQGLERRTDQRLHGTAGTQCARKTLCGAEAMNPGELDYQRLRQLVKSLEKDVQRERDLRLLLEKRCRMYAALINRLTKRR